VFRFGARESSKKALEARAGLLNDPLMLPQPHRSGRKRRRFFRQNPQFMFILFFMIIVVLLVAGLFWLITSPDFVKTR
jgi:hypothetical protein